VLGWEEEAHRDSADTHKEVVQTSSKECMDAERTLALQRWLCLYACATAVSVPCADVNVLWLGKCGECSKLCRHVGAASVLVVQM
jgi:hypothetical protein